LAELSVLVQFRDSAEDGDLSVGQGHVGRVPPAELHVSDLAVGICRRVENAGEADAFDLREAEVLRIAAVAVEEARLVVPIGAAGDEETAIRQLRLVGAEEVVIVGLHVVGWVARVLLRSAEGTPQRAGQAVTRPAGRAE
jgi:hypothetical protein